jgi:hypothetical protein
MSSHHILHLLHNAHKEGEKGNHKLEGAVCLGAGFALVPMGIGIPMMLYGAYKLWKK